MATLREVSLYTLADQIEGVTRGMLYGGGPAANSELLNNTPHCPIGTPLMVLLVHPSWSYWYKLLHPNFFDTVNTIPISIGIPFIQLALHYILTSSNSKDYVTNMYRYM